MLSRETVRYVVTVPFYPEEGQKCHERQLVVVVDGVEMLGLRRLPIETIGAVGVGVVVAGFCGSTDVWKEEAVALLPLSILAMDGKARLCRVVIRGTRSAVHHKPQLRNSCRSALRRERKQKFEAPLPQAPPLKEGDRLQQALR